MSKLLKIKKGLDLNIAGAIEEVSIPSSSNVEKVAVTPDDFTGLSPKLTVKEGDIVRQGEPVLSDKSHTDIKICSPLSGKIAGIIRGERRKIIRIIIESDGSEQTRTIDPATIKSVQDIKTALLQSGIWARIRQLPYDIIPNPDTSPRDIFVTAFDTAPLAGDLLLQPGVDEKNILKGLDALSKLTTGKVYLSTRSDFTFATGNAEHIIVEGPHPAGLPSIQAGNLKPVNKGETIWLTDIVTVAKIGQLLNEGRYTFRTLVALTGSEVSAPHYVSTIEGAEIAPILKGCLKDSARHIRIISGNVLSGHKVNDDGFLRFPYRQITVIPEGDDKDEFMGWASMSPSKLSASKSFPLSFFGKIFSPDARLNGGRRAMIMSGIYDRMVPLDIMPEYLIKAILSKNIDRMEQLGIYEVTPEDFALAEFVDPSKLELQKIVRDGLVFLRKETE